VRTDMATRAAFASAEEGYVTRARNTGVDDRDAIGSSKLRINQTEKSHRLEQYSHNARWAPPSPFTDARGSRSVASRTRVRSRPDHQTRRHGRLE
jgi:hypothetical protein